jgi:hypothetical protein
MLRIHVAVPLDPAHGAGFVVSGASVALWGPATAQTSGADLLGALVQGRRATARLAWP